MTSTGSLRMVDGDRSQQPHEEKERDSWPDEQRGWQSERGPVFFDRERERVATEPIEELSPREARARPRFHSAGM